MNKRLKYLKYYKENINKFRYAVVENTEHPYYERVFYEIIKNCADELTTCKDRSPHNLIPQYLFTVCDRYNNVITARFPDFLDPYKKVIIEIDGKYHNTKEQHEYDVNNELLYKRCGYKVYRLKNEDVADKGYKLLKQIYK